VPSHGKSEIREKHARFAEWSPWGRRIWVCDRPTGYRASREYGSVTSALGSGFLGSLRVAAQ